jgi:hypothetical protein
MKTLIMSLGLSMIPAFAAGHSAAGNSGDSGGAMKLVAAFVGTVLAAMLRTWLFGKRKDKVEESVIRSFRPRLPSHSTALPSHPASLLSRHSGSR